LKVSFTFFCFFKKKNSPKSKLEGVFHLEKSEKKNQFCVEDTYDIEGQFHFFLFSKKNSSSLNLRVHSTSKKVKKKSILCRVYILKVSLFFVFKKKKSPSLNLRVCTCIPPRKK
jgi:hypothetical protein